MQTDVGFASTADHPNRWADEMCRPRLLPIIAFASLFTTSCLFAPQSYSDECAPTNEDYVGRWRITWLEGYEWEIVTIKDEEAGNNLYLEYSNASCVGISYFQHVGHVQDGVLMIEGGYSRGNRFYDSLLLDTSGVESVLMPTPLLYPKFDPEDNAFLSMLRGEAYVIKELVQPENLGSLVYIRLPDAAQHDDATDRPPADR